MLTWWVGEGPRRSTTASTTDVGTARVTVKRKATGEDDKKAYNAVREAVRKLEQDRDTGNVRKAGRVMSVEEWLAHWLENTARPSLKKKAYAAYRTAVHHHLIPALDNHKMDHQRLKPEHFKRLYAAILKAGGKPGTAHQVHRTARTAFGEAHRHPAAHQDPRSAPARASPSG